MALWDFIGWILAAHTDLHGDEDAAVANDFGVTVLDMRSDVLAHLPYAVLFMWRFWSLHACRSIAYDAKMLMSILHVGCY